MTPGDQRKQVAARRRTIQGIVRAMRTAQLQAGAKTAPAALKIEKRPRQDGVWKGGC